MGNGSRLIRLSAAGATDIGRGRQHNEDAVLVRADMNLYIVADGAGGHNAGNVASALATTSIANAFEAGASRFLPGEADVLGPPIARRLASAIHSANREIIEIAKSVNKYKGMGTTVVAVVYSPETSELHVAHVGDSRCYRLRFGAIEQLTHDHSLFNDVLEMRPEIDESALSRLPKRVVTRALGMTETFRVSIRSHLVQPGDRFLLCSDGITDALDPDIIADKLGGEGVADDIVRELIESALFIGADDNIAALVLVADGGGAFEPAKRAVKSYRPPRPLADTLEGPDPEIIITNIEALEAGEAEARISVVPASGTEASHTDAFAGLRMRRPKTKDPNE